ncbi:prostate-associated microseminoprotein-like [Chanos chanos]|uniref:Prostate-associated microseminoprotein-like n=1 Tax=Chanos chanos TaxID=29144 RepID=A0A6J2WJI6_CHACN|nr:prostate-associated microseminoprotein-like [Chanos chanos]
MRGLLAVLCSMSVFLPYGRCIYGRGECYFNGKASCEYQNQLFNIGESWVTEDCFQCVCLEPFGVGCCENGPQLVDYPDWCEAIRKPDSCTVAVVMKANHKLPCLFGRQNQLRLGKGPIWKSENDPLY